MSDTKEPKGIYKAIPKIMKDIGPVDKKGKHEKQGWSYQKTEDIINAANSAFAANSVFILPEVQETRSSKIETKGGTYTRIVLKVKWTLSHEDGSQVECVTEGEGFDGGDKATGKASTNAFKQMLTQVFMVSTKPTENPPQQKEEPKRKETKPIRQAPKPKPKPKNLKYAIKHKDDEFILPLGKLKNKALGELDTGSLQEYANSYVEWCEHMGQDPDGWFNDTFMPYLDLRYDKETKGSM